MMATTHVLAGVALATVTLFLAPEFAPVALAAGAIGGLFPDLDLYAGHRKTLHYPMYYGALAVAALAVAAVVPSPVSVGAGFFLLAAAAHSVMDIFGGGLELRPWLGQSDRAVYCHLHGRWLRPRRWIRYDGAPEDVALAALLGAPAALLYGEPVRDLVVVVLAISAGYSLLRKRLVTIAEWLVSRLPTPALAYVPERFVENRVR